MMRWLFHTLALISLLLCFATVALWVRSYTWMDTYSSTTSRYESAGWAVMSRNGEASFHVAYLKYDWQRNTERWDHFKVTIWGAPNNEPSFLGIRIEEESSEDSDNCHIYVAYAWIVYLFAALPVLWCFSTFRRVRYKRRLRNNHCQACNYNLQGSAGDACPECGSKRLQSL